MSRQTQGAQSLQSQNAGVLYEKKEHSLERQQTEAEKPKRPMSGRKQRIQSAKKARVKEEFQNIGQQAKILKAIKEVQHDEAAVTSKEYAQEE